jgi:hypothetical protein
MNTEFKNPFDEMENDHIQTFFQGSADARIKAKLDNTMGTIRFLSNIADVYLGRLVDTVVGMTGGDVDNASNPASDEQSLLPKPDSAPKYPNR